MTTPAILVLENGRVFHGASVGPMGERMGEVVFNTALSGYQEILSDASYAGQIIVMTAPQIGNTGVNRHDMEGCQLHCRGLVMREASPVTSSWRSETSLSEFLVEHGVPGIDGIDTRALTRVLREQGAMRGAISTDVDDSDGVLGRVRSTLPMEGLDLVSGVTCKAPYAFKEEAWRAPGAIVSPSSLSASEPANPYRVVAYDFGIKRGILRELRALGCDVTVVPASTPVSETLALDPDGVFLSNGPGDPSAVSFAVEIVRELIRESLPVFGICLGHQILSLALGAKTFKLPFGHHGGNHPVMDLETRKVEITSQNHGFAVDPSSLPQGVRCTHKNLYDGTVEGIEVSGARIFGVQYHPEASPGPHDASHLFRRFTQHMRNHGSR